MTDRSADLKAALVDLVAMAARVRELVELEIEELKQQRAMALIEETNRITKRYPEDAATREARQRRDDWLYP